MPSSESPGAPKQGERPIELYLVGAELAFLLVPFVVIGLAYLFKADFRTIFYTPYWSVASSILIGQALIRFVSRLLQSRAHDPSISWERVTLIFSVLIVLGLVPSLVVLLLVLISTQSSTYLGIAQVILFVFGVWLFLALLHTVMVTPATIMAGPTNTASIGSRQLLMHATQNSARPVLSSNMGHL